MEKRKTRRSMVMHLRRIPIINSTTLIPDRSSSVSHKTLVVVAGPTAVGKTATAIRLAQHFRTEIISADSRQFFREMKIGTAVPSDEELAMIKHHFIGQRSIHDNYNVSKYEKEALACLDALFEHHNIVVMAGGSGLYIDAVCRGMDALPDPDEELRNSLKQTLSEKGIDELRLQLRALDPETYHNTDISNPVRVIRALEICLITGKKVSELRTSTVQKRDFNIIKIALDKPREALFEIINKRVDAMMAAGLLAEAKSLYPFRTLNSLNTVGYRELFASMDGTVSLEEAIEKIKTNTRRYAKRQLTWFRRDKDYIWYGPDQVSEIIEFVQNGID